MGQTKYKYKETDTVKETVFKNKENIKDLKDNSTFEDGTSIKTQKSAGYSKSESDKKFQTKISNLEYINVIVDEDTGKLQLIINEPDNTSNFSITMTDNKVSSIKMNSKGNIFEIDSDLNGEYSIAEGNNKVKLKEVIDKSKEVVKSWKDITNKWKTRVWKDDDCGKKIRVEYLINQTNEIVPMWIEKADTLGFSAISTYSKNGLIVLDIGLSQIRLDLQNKKLIESNLKQNPSTKDLSIVDLDLTDVIKKVEIYE